MTERLKAQKKDGEFRCEFVGSMSFLMEVFAHNVAGFLYEQKNLEKYGIDKEEFLKMTCPVAYNLVNEDVKHMWGMLSDAIGFAEKKKSEFDKCKGDDDNDDDEEDDEEDFFGDGVDLFGGDGK